MMPVDLDPQRGIMDGRSSFQTFLADRMERNQREHHSAGLTAADRQEIQGFAFGLVAASALTSQEATALIADMESIPLVADTRTISMTQAIPRKTEQPAVSAPFKKAHDAADEPGVGEEQHNTPLRVVPIIGPHVDQTTDPVFLSIEIWSTMIAVRIAHPTTERSFADILSDDRTWRGIDDAGTKYRQCGSVSSDVKGMIISTRFFEPGPTPEAHELSLTMSSFDRHDRTVQLPLRHV
jgi:hypothetical protein